MGRKTELEYTVRTLDEGSRFVIDGHNKTVRTTDTMTFQATPTGSRVTYHAEFDFKGLVGKLAPALSPVLRPALERLGNDAQKQIKQNLDRL